MKIKIILNDKTLTATLNSSQTSRDFIALLPLTLQLKDYAGEEKIGDLPRRLSTAGAPAVPRPLRVISRYMPRGEIWRFSIKHTDMRRD